MGKLVSIITPCFNGELYIARFLDSILYQTYDKIELIIINDGSTDKTEEIILSYQSKFEQRGFKFCYIFQENSGQSAAINKGLSIFKGEYLTWPDSDDAFTFDAIEKKVKYLEEHPERGIVICTTEVVEEFTFKHLGYLKRIPPKNSDNLFFDLISGHNVYYAPGGYMVRSSMFRDVMPKPVQIQAPREIGQNFQLLLPIAYNYPCGYIFDICYLYTVRKDSHSHTKKTSGERKIIIDISNEVLNNIAKSITHDENEYQIVHLAIQKRKINSLFSLIQNYQREDLLPEVLSLIQDNKIDKRLYRYRFFSIKHRVIARFFSKIRCFIVKIIRQLKKWFL